MTSKISSRDGKVNMINKKILIARTVATLAITKEEAQKQKAKWIKRGYTVKIQPAHREVSGVAKYVVWIEQWV